MRNSKEVIDYLNRLRKQQDLSISELARRVDMSKSTVSLYFNKKREFPVNRLDDFAKVLGTTPEDVLGVKPKDSSENSQPDIVFYPISAGYQRVSIPVVGEIACGDPITADENIDGYTEEVFKKPIPDGQLFALRCKGHSMEPTIPDGALAIVREQPEVEDGEIAAVLVDHDSEATLKRIKHQGQLVMLLPDNTDYDPIILSKDNPGRIIGKVIHVSWDIK